MSNYFCINKNALRKEIKSSSAEWNDRMKFCWIFSGIAVLQSILKNEVFEIKINPFNH